MNDVLSSTLRPLVKVPFTQYQILVLFRDDLQIGEIQGTRFSFGVLGQSPPRLLGREFEDFVQVIIVKALVDAVLDVLVLVVCPLVF